jgi:homopolymeric O-antigen transport system permease protein
MNIQNVLSECINSVQERSSVSTPVTDGFVSAVRAELFAGLLAWPIWVMLGWDDIRQRYRRSLLGPFWITLSMAVFIFVLGIIYSRLFHTDIKVYLPFLAVGFIVWGFLASSANESCLAFQEGHQIIKQIKLPYSVYVLRIIWRNFIVFFHTIIIFLPIAVFFKLSPSLTTMLLALPGLCLIVLNVFWVGIVLAIVSTRYRDIQPIVVTTIQLAMFATPIMWQADSLGEATIVAEVNPIYHLIELVRAPMLGTPPELLSWLVAGALAAAGWLSAACLLVAKARRIVFWL